jgi:hypothetical protein
MELWKMASFDRKLFFQRRFFLSVGSGFPGQSSSAALKNHPKMWSFPKNMGRRSLKVSTSPAACYFTRGNCGWGIIKSSMKPCPVSLIQPRCLANNTWWVNLDSSMSTSTKKYQKIYHKRWDLHNNWFWIINLNSWQYPEVKVWSNYILYIIWMRNVIWSFGFNIPNHPKSIT